MSLAAQRAQAFVQPVEAVDAAPAAYVGIVTRTIAFSLDAAVIQLVAIAVGGMLALIMSVVAPSDDLNGVLALVSGVAYGLWVVGYFALFWSATGQTPGNRLLQIRVCRAVDGAPVGLGTAVLRFVGLVIAALPLFAGFVPIVLDDRRRGAHDFLAGTVVVSAPHTLPP
jgi:uncharacterized RDD family membrane protein YckC